MLAGGKAGLFRDPSPCRRCEIKAFCDGRHRLDERDVVIASEALIELADNGVRGPVQPGHEGKFRAGCSIHRVRC